MTRLYALILSAAMVGLAGPVAAHPHENDRLTEFREKTQELADRARESGEALADSDVIANMSELLNDFATRVEVEQGEGAGAALWFDGDEVVRFHLDSDVDDRVTITGLGENLSVARETVITNGQTRTRIVIEMDGGDDVEIDMPRSPTPPVPPSDQE